MKRKTLRMAAVFLMVAIAGFCAGWCLEQSRVTSSMTLAAEEKEVPIYFVETDEKKSPFHLMRPGAASGQKKYWIRWRNIM